MKEFTIPSRKNKFRVKDLNAVELLALQTQLDFKNLQKTTSLFYYILENTEVEIGDKWFSVKDGNTYYPLDIKNDVKSVNDIIDYFIENVLKPSFTQSNQ